MQGFDHTGQEQLWTVTGDEVSAMISFDADGDGMEELLVGSMDFEVRAFKGEELLQEIRLSAPIAALCHLEGTAWAYALENGTVGVYSDLNVAVWSVKTKHRPQCLAAFDIDSDGVLELCIGWSNGKIEIRKSATGKIEQGQTGGPLQEVPTVWRRWCARTTAWMG